MSLTTSHLPDRSPIDPRLPSPLRIAALLPGPGAVSGFQHPLGLVSDGLNPCQRIVKKYSRHFLSFEVTAKGLVTQAALEREMQTREMQVPGVY